MPVKETDVAAPPSAQGQARDQQQARNENRNEKRGDNAMARRDAPMSVSPLALMQRFFSDDIAGLFAQIGDRQRSMTPQSNVQAPSFVPRVDVVQRGSELVVRTDLPGMSPDDVVVEVGDDSIIISGERQQEDAADNGGIYRFERTYGAFVREIPLPKGADVDRATATFKDGVLEITVPAPSQQDSRGRRLQINRGENTKNDDADKNARPNP